MGKRQSKRSHRTNPGFTLFEIFFVTTILLLMVSLLLPAIQAVREMARRVSCCNNLTQIGIALNNYHAAYQQYPPGAGGTMDGTNLRNHNQGRLSALVALTPFLEQNLVWLQISNPWTGTSGVPFPSMGPSPLWNLKAEGMIDEEFQTVLADTYLPFTTLSNTYVCPSSPVSLASYAVNYGDGYRDVGASPLIEPGSKRGVFMRLGRGPKGIEGIVRMGDIHDGLSHTLAMLEISDKSVARNVPGLNGVGGPLACAELADPARPTFFPPLGVSVWPAGVRGTNWVDGHVKSTGATTILPPNDLSCTGLNNENDAVISASSFHRGGCHVLFVHGEVRFVSNSIDVGQAKSPNVCGISDTDGNVGAESPFGIWGALGTRAAAEISAM